MGVSHSIKGPKGLVPASLITLMVLTSIWKRSWTHLHGALLLVHHVGLLAADAQVLQTLQVHRGHHLLHHRLLHNRLLYKVVLLLHGLLYRDVGLLLLHRDVGLLLLHSLLHRDQVPHRLIGAVQRVRQRRPRLGRDYPAGHRLRRGHFHGPVGRRRLLARLDRHLDESAKRISLDPQQTRQKNKHNNRKLEVSLSE